MAKEREDDSMRSDLAMESNNNCQDMVEMIIIEQEEKGESAKGRENSATGHPAPSSSPEG